MLYGPTTLPLFFFFIAALTSSLLIQSFTNTSKFTIFPPDFLQHAQSVITLTCCTSFQAQSSIEPIDTSHLWEVMGCPWAALDCPHPSLMEVVSEICAAWAADGPSVSWSEAGCSNESRCQPSCCVFFLSEIFLLPLLVNSTVSHFPVLPTYQPISTQCHPCRAPCGWDFGVQQGRTSLQTDTNAAAERKPLAFPPLSSPTLPVLLFTFFLSQ